jgi:hypothetical protein
LEPVASKAKYLVLVRENYAVMILPANLPEEIMIGLTMDSNAEPAGIYQLVSTFLNEEFKVMKKVP